ncbi:hypothetical protein QVD17_28447 [Tagetes erecta]|uniref:Uncharacterized protein n=1 Tax=Tagetes erecta TaxID=13708 RepID=A0AAD8NSG0_TARER|nr:hypothetical protein QVD17_28447 [Tagetes erecta]
MQWTDRIFKPTLNCPFCPRQHWMIHVMSSYGDNFVLMTMASFGKLHGFEPWYRYHHSLEQTTWQIFEVTETMTQHQLFLTPATEIAVAVSCHLGWHLQLEGTS